jgi:spore coat protein U-like protein
LSLLKILSLGKGQHSAGFTTRDLLKSGGADIVNYNLYLDAAKTQIWRDGTGGSLTWRPTGNGSHTIYGKAPAGQTAPGAGSYTDTVVITINF